MTKYIISSGTSIVNEILENQEFVAVKISNKPSEAVQFNTIGDAMREASKVNKILGSAAYRAAPIEI